MRYAAALSSKGRLTRCTVDGLTPHSTATVRTLRPAARAARIWLIGSWGGMRFGQRASAKWLKMMMAAVLMIVAVLMFATRRAMSTRAAGNSRGAERAVSRLEEIIGVVLRVGVAASSVFSRSAWGCRSFRPPARAPGGCCTSGSSSCLRRQWRV